ncbi:hypothetical protein GobsT_01470 [Gemmata obscuriglobus]|uniref:VWA domain-containing protein n=1 Tax=Gemmata obscuriglobus TaxID=114 RepID=A0A2Z3HBW9_9BACT|nr:vWA domain-containing protein [Gemmata obscuriglobus]AWM41236.1 VWA domain-containing protein [Gemmata obscuriglobus]QEG25421.1 hypothetical protein GobsT_01470 [Gemmata obscuriglobus]VTR98528.1 von Willebrand factor, type A OS=Crocosphaera watsonii WH 0005 GN=CWATWH0005_988 PE=4 SV=1: VWA_2 [Gemmata obscuriglobus UQM 2246]
MPAPKMLSGLPKPVLFGLYGAVGGLLGALLFGELIMLALGPKIATAALPPPPEPRLAVSAPTAVQIYQGGTNKVLVQIARDAFEGDVAVRIDGLPPGVSASAPDVTIPANRTDGEIELAAAFGGAVGAGPQNLKVVATAKAGEKTVTAESAPFPITTLASPMPQADIVFVLDVTGSMQNQIDGLKNGIGTFSRDLERAKVDARFGCVAFRDLTMPERDPVTYPSLQVLKFQGDAFTADAAKFAAAVGRQRAAGGGDDPESSLEAIIEASKFDFRKGAVRTLILITDAAPKSVQGLGASLRSASDALAAHKVDLLHLVINSPGHDEYVELQRSALGVPGEKGGGRGKVFNLDRTASDATAFTTVLLPEMTKAVIAAAEAKPTSRPDLPKQEVAPPELKTIKAVQSNQTYDAASTGQLVLAVSVWTGAIAALVCLFLLGGQQHYLRGTLPSAGGAVAGLAGGAAVGLVGGAAGQGLFLLAPDNPILGVIFRVLGWTILGALAGAGLSLFVPNLKPKYGLAGGAAGGAAGAIGYIVVASAASAVLGRLAGGLALGLCIGLMVAVVEAAFRSAWLEVRYGPRETVTVNLGAEPVKIGGDARACTVWARGAAAVALRYFIRDGRVICTDVPAREEAEVTNGDTREVGNVTVVVRTGSGARPPAPPAPRPAAPPIPKAKPAPKPLDLDEDDGLPLPMPASPPPAAPRAATPFAPPPVPPRPSAPPLAGRPPAPQSPTARPPVAPVPTPPAAPAPKPPTRDPDACPVCGRKNPGRPGSRYCMVCDQTY